METYCKRNSGYKLHEQIKYSKELCDGCLWGDSGSYIPVMDIFIENSLLINICEIGILDISKM